MSGLTNHYRERMVACLLAEQGRAELCAYLGDEAATAMRARVDALLALPEAERAQVIEQEREGIRTAEAVVLLGEIHPSWLLDVMTKESPRIIGLLLRFLPSRHARYILEHLPVATRDALPDIVDAFAVNDTVVQIVRHWFESHFVPVRPASQVERLDLSTLHALGLDELQHLIHALGVEELAIALTSLPKNAQRVILNRLPFDAARELLGRLNAISKTDPVLEHEARFTVMEVTIDRRSPDELINEVGIAALAKTFTRANLVVLPLLRQKLPPRLAYLLQRDVEAHVVTTSSVALVRQRILLERLHSLLNSGHLEAPWRDRIAPINEGETTPSEVQPLEKAV